MILKYFFARLKRNIVLTLVGSLTIFLVMLILVVSFSLPEVLDTVLVNYHRQLCGDADLVVTNSHDTADRFFSLTLLRDDSVLKTNSQYINGYFKTFAQIQTDDSDKEFCILFAADYNQLNQYNPITTKGYKPLTLSDNDIIISEDYAYEMGLERGREVQIAHIGGDAITFKVACIASKEGIFHAGNAVFISSAALKRIIPFFGSTISTHCFIKAKDAAGLDAIKQAFKTEAKFQYFDIQPALDAELLQRTKNDVVVPLYCVAVVVVVFCIMSLLILLRLIFARDHDNFTLLRSLGMPNIKILIITLLTGLLMCTLAIISAGFAISFVVGIIKGFSYLFSGVSISTMAYIFGLGGGFILGVISAVLNGREKKQKESFKKLTQRKRAFPYWSLFVISIAIGIFAFFAMYKIPYIALVLAIASMIGFVALLPKVAAPLFSFCHKLFKSIYSIRLEALSKSRDWQKFVAFISVGMLVLLIISLSLNGIQEKLNTTFPFDIVVTEINSPDAELLDKVKAVDGVEEAITCNFQLRAACNFGDLAFKTEIIAVDNSNLNFFNLTGFMSLDSAIISKKLADDFVLAVGDVITFSNKGNPINFRISDIFDCDSTVMLIDIANVNSAVRPYSEILIKSNNIEGTIKNIYRDLNVALSVLDVPTLVNFMTSLYADFIWILDMFTMFLAVLVAVTAVLMIVIRRISDVSRQVPLVPLGLIKSADIKHNLVSAIFALLPAIIFLPILALFVTRTTFAIFYMFGKLSGMSFNFPIVLYTTLAGFGIVILLELVTCFFISPCNKKRS